MSFSPEKWDYGKKRKFRYELQDYMQKVFGFDKWAGKTVLEIGCGSGIDAVEFARNGAIVVATDITDNAVEFTRELAKEAEQDILVMKVLGDASPLQNERFDCVYSYGVLHHVPDVDRVLKEAHRLLKPGGVIMAMLYHKDSLLFGYSIMYLHGVREKLLWRGHFRMREGAIHILNDEQDLASMYSERYEGCPYTKAYTKQEAIDLFSKYFKDVRVSVHYNVVDLLQQRKVKLGISDEYELGWRLVVKAVK